MRIHSAMDRGDDLEAVRGCESYLGSLRGRDDPEPAVTAQVRTAYKRAFVRWFLANAGAKDSDSARRLSAFRTLMANSETGKEGK